jgi:DivIVA domain-containing protein
MSDEIFQVTAHDIRGQEFQRVMRGYDPAQVESFKQRMAEEFDRVLRERVALDERLKNMVEQLRQYRDRERALNDALVSAQQLRADMQAQATREAELVMKEARAEAARVAERAEAEEAGVQQRTEAAVRQYAAYLNGFRALLERHGAELASLESYLDRADDRPDLRASA